MRGQRRERGAAVVEFALVVPILLLLVMGIAEFGRAYYIQTTLSQAAREGVREMALKNNATDARSTTKSSASPLVLTDGQISVFPSTCVTSGTTPAEMATVTITYPVAFLTTLFGNGVTLKGKGVMRCNG